MPFLNRVSICPQGDVINLRDLLFRFSGKKRFENVATRRATIDQFQVFVCVHGHRPASPARDRNQAVISDITKLWNE